MKLHGCPFASSKPQEAPSKISRTEFNNLVAARAKELAGGGNVSDVHTSMALKEVNRRMKDKQISVIGYLYSTPAFSKDDLSGRSENGNKKI